MKGDNDTTKSPCWCFTLWTKELTINTNFCDKNEVVYYIAQPEKCPTTGREHWQGYLQCKKEVCRRSVRAKIFKCKNDGSVCLTRALGTLEDNIKYCSKSKTKNGETITWGTPRPGQGHRTDLDNMIADAKFCPVDILVDKYGMNGLRHIHHLQTYQKSLYMPSKIDKIMKNKYITKRILDDNNLDNETKSRYIVECNKYWMLDDTNIDDDFYRYMNQSDDPTGPTHDSNEEGEETSDE